MALLLDARQPEFEGKLRAFLRTREGVSHSVSGAVGQIIQRVRDEGDAALLEYTKTFDDPAATLPRLRVSEQEIQEGFAACAPAVRTALELGAARIAAYSEKQMPCNESYTDALGVELGWRWNAMQRVGVYVPGGRARYPSSVLMNVVPAKVAGVEQVVMVTPGNTHTLDPAILAAAHIAGVEEIWRIGGAQAVAALAYGTESIAPVDKIVGPGNAYVTQAKRQVFGKVGIDMIAGPSEIMVVADARTPPAWTAADLLSQAEHDPHAQSILLTTDAAYADAVIAAVEALLDTLPTQEVARASWEKFGAVMLLESMEDAPGIINHLAPEHLMLSIENPLKLAASIRYAGAIFLGRHTPEAVGDYLAGPSHVLPTNGTARFSSGLSVYDFLTRSSLIGCSAASLKSLAAPGVALAECEGLPAHAQSLRVRQ